MDAEDVLVTEAEDEGELAEVAHALGVRAWSSREGLDHHAVELLERAALHLALERGADHVDLGAVDRLVASAFDAAANSMSSLIPS